MRAQIFAEYSLQPLPIINFENIYFLQSYDNFLNLCCEYFGPLDWVPYFTNNSPITPNLLASKLEYNLFMLATPRSSSAQVFLSVSTVRWSSIVNISKSVRKFQYIDRSRKQIKFLFGLTFIEN